jgi:hypothetical protein
VAKQSIAALVLIEMDPDTFDVSTAGSTAALRKAVLDNLCNATRLVAVMTEDEARLMMAAHEAGLRALGGEINRPPADYIPPTRD